MENPSTHVAATIREKCRFTVRSTVSTTKCYTGANIKYPNSVIILVLSGGHRGVILDYFGDDHDEYCDNCGNCTYIADCDQPSSTGGKTKKTKTRTSTQGLDLAEIDATIAGFVYDRERMLGFGYGIRKTIRSLMGDTGEGVDDRDIDQLDGYGAFSDLDEDVIEDRIHKLIDDGTIYVGSYHTLLEP